MLLYSNDRFDFGKNWNRFLRIIDEQRIHEAELSLCTMLSRDSLEGLSFLDIGSGSGLFSLAAARLKALKIHSFDYDTISVACTRELKKRFFRHHPSWTIEQGSVLDQAYLRSLGEFDVVYAWGVLHHTGEMWQAMRNIKPSVVRYGQIFISIYNDQGLKSVLWREIKRFYNQIPPWLQGIYAGIVWAPIEMVFILQDVVAGHSPLSHLNNAKRGMSYWHDVMDWLGGYPFEVAKPEEIIRLYLNSGFVLKKLKMKHGIGCNEFVFERRSTV